MNPTSASGLLTGPNRPIVLKRYPATGGLAVFLEYFWSVHWHLSEGETFTSVNIPFPCTHIVYEHTATGIFGQVRGSFNKTLTGEGFVLGARFKSGYFYPYSGMPADKLTDQQLDLNELFPQSSHEIDLRIHSENNVQFALTQMAELLSQRLPIHVTPALAKAESVYSLIKWVEENATVNRVADLCEYAELSERQLERLFKTYVGLSPKWVIRLFRLQQLANHVVSSEPIDWADLALKLGYFDQAHCVNDFKRFTGKPPSSFR
jgi:AraC-like DNA-binding protein